MAQNISEKVLEIIKPFADELSLQIWDVVFKKRAQIGICAYSLIKTAA